VCSAITTVSKSELKRKILSKSEIISISKRKKKVKSKKSLGQHESKCPQNWSKLHPNDQNRTKEAIIGQKWSKIFQLDVPNMFELVPNDSNWPKMAKSKISNKVHLEK